MRIGYLCADRGICLTGHKGAAAHVRGFLRALARQHHDVVAITPDPGQGDLGVAVAHVPTPLVASQLPADVPAPVVRALGHVWNNVAVEQALQQVLSRHRAELLYERYSPFGVAGGIVAKRLGIPHVLEVNAPLAWEGTQYRQQAMPDAATALERAAFVAPTLIVTVSDELRRQLMDEGVAPSRLMVVPNGVDIDLFTPDGPARRLAPTASIAVGFIGGLRPWHGVDVLLEAFARLTPQFHLVVVGDGPLAKDVRLQLPRFEGRITLAGAMPHEEIPAVLRGIDIAVAPYSRLDHFYFSPLKVLEYMASGRAIVAADVGQLRTLLRDGETGVLVPPGDPAALAGAITMLGADAARRQGLGARAADEARASHAWMHRASAILSRLRRAA